MGVGYYYGTFVEQDKETGMMLLKKACDSDCTDALNTIGMILNEEKRYDESFPYNKRSAEKGDMYGLHNLGNAYFYARGVERDVKKAFDLWTEAGDKGNPDSHFTIGNIFFRGGVCRTRHSISHQMLWICRQSSMHHPAYGNGTVSKSLSNDR